MRRCSAIPAVVIQLLVLVVALSWQSSVSAAPAKAKVTANSTNVFEIGGMTCEGCVKGLNSELRRVPGVASVSVTLSNKLAVVAVDTNKVSNSTLIKTVEEAGYTAKPKP